MEDKNLIRKLKRRPKWKVADERDDLMFEQQLLRKENAELEAQLSISKDNEIAALKSNNGAAIAVLDREIESLEKKIANNERHYKANAELLEVYSKVLKNDREGKAAHLGSVVGAVTGVIGAGAAVGGLIAAYHNDEGGGLINKKTFEWAKSLLPKFGRK